MIMALDIVSASNLFSVLSRSELRVWISMGLYCYPFFLPFFVESIFNYGVKKMFLTITA